MGDSAYLPFMIGEALCAFPVKSVATVLDLPAIEAVPKAPPELRGVLNLRGNIVAVIDPFALFGIEGSGSAVVVAELGEGRLYGMLASEVLKVLTLPEPADPASAPPGVGVPRDFLAGISIHEGRWRLVLDPAKVFDLKRVFASSEGSAP
jgi:purine-binding chemotaxis protein CheW